MAALPEALAQWTVLKLPPVLHDGWCVCVCLCGSPFLVSGLSVCFRSPHLQAEYPSLPSSIHSCSSLPPHTHTLFHAYQKVEAIVGLSGVGFCSPAAASSPHGPCKTRLLLPRGPQASAALPPNKFAVTLSAIGPRIGSK